MLTSRNLIRTVIGLNIADLGVNVFLVSAGYVEGGLAPIFRTGEGAAPLVVQADRMVDPIPQALVLTAIVIGFGITALALTLVMRLYARRGTVEIAELRGLKW